MSSPTVRQNGAVSPPPMKKRKVDSTITKTAVSNFFKPASEKPPERVTWRIINKTLLVARYTPEQSIKPSVHDRKKIAAFDLDSTIIKTSSGLVHARDASDWRWWDPSVPRTLKQLYEDGYHIAILTNQGSISLRSDSKTAKGDQQSLLKFKHKVAAVFDHFNFPVVLLAATDRDIYRKPRTGMWDELLDELDLEGPGAAGGIDLAQCIFVGDAAGRAKGSNRKEDHACSDRDFASNVGIPFHTPEEFFLKEDVVPFTRPFEPKDYLSPLNATTDSNPLVFAKTNDLDIVLMCGSPGCGKSTFYFNKLRPLGYERVNQDTLGNRDRCVKVAREHLRSGRCVAVDNTNADAATRGVWVKQAQALKVPVRCVWFTAPPVLCEHNEAVRALASSLSKHTGSSQEQNAKKGVFNPEGRSRLPRTAFYGFTGRFQPPNAKNEKLQEVVKVDFLFEGGPAERDVWSMYWV